MKTLPIILLVLCSSILFAQSDTSSIVLSEIMFNAESGNNEFIELYNTSTTKNIDLKFYKIQYADSNPDSIIGTGEGTVLKPKSYAVIFEGDYKIDSGIYKNYVSTNALILKIADNSFGSRGMANSSNRTISLINSASDTVEMYTYTANNDKEISDEKIIMNQNDDKSNWANSNKLYGTPGRMNSVSPFDYDLKLSMLNYQPKIPIEGNSILLNASIINNGIQIAQNFTISLFNDVNNDSTGEPSEKIDSKNINLLLPGDSIKFSSAINNVKAGNYNIIAEIEYSKDERKSDNSKFINFTVYKVEHNYNDIVINEIMYAPPKNENEWIELYNNSSSKINLNGWLIGDNSNANKIAGKNIFINPDSYLVISKDSSVFNFYKIPAKVIIVDFPTLNNNGDAVVIKDSLGILIDSVNYLPVWGGQNDKSLERINPLDASNDSLNWGSSKSVQNATPGKINSLTQKQYDLEFEGISFSPQFPLIGNDVTPTFKITNIGKSSAVFTIQIFEDINLDSIPDLALFTSSALNLGSGDSVKYTPNFSIKNVQNQIGVYAKIIYDKDQDTTNNNFYSEISPGVPVSSVVINEIMFKPEGGEPEWIELYNKSNETVNLKGWKISDVVTIPKTTVLNNQYHLAPKSYLVISNDSSILDYHRKIPGKLIVTQLSVLNNDEDGVVLTDNRGITIDSVFYNISWGGNNGYSLERISPLDSSNSSSNWSSSIDIENSTPGRINSISTKTYDLSVSKILFSPSNPLHGDNVYISSIIKNIGFSRASSFAVQFYIDTNADSVVDNLLSEKDNLSLNSGDSLTIQSSIPLQKVESNILCAIKIKYKKDDDTTNNFRTKLLVSGFKSNSISINEIMYEPKNNEPEWVELINSSNDTLNLKNWSVSDLLPYSSIHTISHTDLILSPGMFLIISKDSSFFSYHPNTKAMVQFVNFGTLGNTSDGIAIYDFENNMIDSVLYKSSWGGVTGHSLERISLKQPSTDSTNWKMSIAPGGSTPGEKNSVLHIVTANRNDLEINEIMYEPDIDNSEFIEFLNSSDKTLNIGGWNIKTGNGNNFFLSEYSKPVPAGAYFVLMADSLTLQKYNLNNYPYKTILNRPNLDLTNNGELLLLKDFSGDTIDSVYYSSGWQNKNLINTKNISLEKINPYLNGNYSSDWSSSASVNGATPGKRNSIYSVNRNISSKISVSPNPFSPDNDGFEDCTVINYRLTQKLAQIRIRIFDSSGRLVRTLADNKPSGQSGSIIFDGKDDSGRTLRIGIYIIFLEALNENNGVLETLKLPVVIARKF